MNNRLVLAALGALLMAVLAGCGDKPEAPPPVVPPANGAVSVPPPPKAPGAKKSGGMAAPGI